MDQQQPTNPVMYARPAGSGVFGTPIPSSVAYIIGALLFLMPFVEIKCTAKKTKENSGFSFTSSSSAMKVTKSGLALAMGNQWRVKMGGLGFSGGSDMDSVKGKEKPKPNLYAIGALVFAVVGAIFAFTKKGAMIAAIAGFVSVAALVLLMLDVQQQIKIPEKTGDGDVGSGWFNNLDNFTLKAAVTPFFYVCIAAVLCGAVFSVMRIRNSRT